MGAYREVFLSESAEYVQAIVDGLLSLEADPHDREPIEVVFRGAHSLKGMAAAMGYERTADLTHRMEGLMDAVRRGEQTVGASLVDLMLRAADAVKLLIEAESGGGVPADVTELLTDIDRAAAEKKAAVITAEEDGNPETEEPVIAVGVGETVYRISVTLEETCVLKAVRAYMALKRLSHMGTVLETVPSAREIEDEAFDRSFQAVVSTRGTPEDISRSLASISEVEDITVTEAQAAPAIQTGSREDRRPIPKLSETQTVRISIGHLDTMVNLVGELVILRSRIESVARAFDSRELDETLEDLYSVSSELQHEVMQTRMVPVSNIFNRFPRMVRDLARDLGKEIRFEMEGLEIELDRTVLDEIGDPVVHLLRNSVDHGVETTEERKAAGKPTKGTVRLEASRERDQVVIVVSDDGRGIDLDRIWAKACQIGLVDPAHRENYSEKDVLLLTCIPGFSMAEKATRVSGRGVGMDVVKGKIEYLGGSLAIRTGLGLGTEFVLTLPLTLAIIQSLLVSISDRVFAIPLGSVGEVLSLDEVEVKTVDGSPVVVLRDRQVVPLHRLDSVLGIEEGAATPLAGNHIVLLEVSGEVRALAVGHLLGRREVVIKPLSAMFKQIKGLGGATVLGDGRVAMILDPRGLFAMEEGA